VTHDALRSCLGSLGGGRWRPANSGVCTRRRRMQSRWPASAA